MAAGRGAARIAAVVTMLAGLVLTGASPASAADDVVRVAAADSFTAGGSAGAVTVTVGKRSKGCVVAQIGLGIRLAGLAADQVRVQAAIGGRWVPLAVSGSGSVGVPRVAPANPTLCHKHSAGVRYRVAFLAGAPSGRVTFVGAAYGNGALMDRASTTARVVGGRAAAATPSAAPSASTSPTPVAEATAEPPVDGSAVAAVPSAAAGATKRDDDGGMGIGVLVMVLGVGMVGIGAALLWFLLRRGRGDATPGAAPGGRHGGGAHRPAEATATLYGSPTTAGPGGPAGYPGATGYGAPAGYDEPTAYGAPGPGYGTPGGVPGAGPPSPGGPGSPGYGGPGGPPPPPAPAGGDSTVVMPRLPY